MKMLKRNYIKLTGVPSARAGIRQLKRCAYSFWATIFICLITISANAQVITTIAGNGIAGYIGNGGPSTAAELSDPFDIALDSAGNIYIADAGNNVIRKINTAGIITTIAGGGMLFYNGMRATDAQLNNPLSIAFDHSGNLFVNDNGNNCIRKIDTAGIIYNVAGNGTTGYSGDSAQATGAQLYDPQGIALDNAGNLYIADYSNSVVRKVDPAGIITTVAGNGASGNSGDESAATAASLTGPTNVMLDNSGNLIIADGGASVIRKVNSAGIITKVAGVGYRDYSGDGGQATNAGLDFPRSLAIDASGNLFIADWWNNVIRKIDPTGIITTVAGNGYGSGMGAGAFAGDSGLATAAEMFDPSAVAVDNAGNIFIVDEENERIRKVTPDLAGVKLLISPLTYITLFPNPNTGSFTLNTTQTENESLAITITNILGQVVYVKEESAQQGNTNTQIKLSDALPNGIYLLYINGADENETVKFEINK